MSEGKPDPEQLLDRTKPVREGEELDLEALAAYLPAHLPDDLGLAAPLTVEVEQFPSGYSNLTYLLKVGGLDMVLRRPPFAVQVKTGHDMGREYRVLSALQGHYPPAPRPYLFCEDESVIGAPFYVMERRRGVILRRTMPRGLELDEASLRALCESLVDELVNLHGVDVEAAGLADLGKPEGYVRRQIDGWRRRWEKAKTDDVEVAAVDELGAWLGAHMPESRSASLIHNDFKFDNMVLDPRDLTRVTAVLDWEMATVGDPLMDLGTALCYWIERDDSEPMKMISFGPTTLPGFWTRKQVAERYAEKTGRSLDDIVFYYCFGLFKTAVVTQQIYYRFAKGLTKDPRFAMMIEATKILSGQAERYLGAKSL